MESSLLYALEYRYYVCYLEADPLAMVYHCKHCGRTVGKLEAPGLSTSTLGLNQLSAEDRKRMLTYEENGDVSIQTICESCEQTLVEYPHYYELDHFLQ